MFISHLGDYGQFRMFSVPTVFGLGGRIKHKAIIRIHIAIPNSPQCFHDSIEVFSLFMFFSI